MKAAFAVWNDRIAPVLDVVRQVDLVEAEDGRILREQTVALPEGEPLAKVVALAELGVNTLVCGAVSRPMAALVTAYGIHVHPFVAGDRKEIIDAWLAGRLRAGLFAMPGCGRGRRFRCERQLPVTLEQEVRMDAENQSGPGPRGGRGRGRGRRGGGMGRGMAGVCVCQQCGYQVPHQRGTPCSEVECPHCGVPLTRQ